MNDCDSSSQDAGAQEKQARLRQVSEQVQVVLVETSHPGNIGSTARAMKNMGLSRLVLVNPQDYPDVKATARASGATDVLQDARVVATLEQAIADSALVIGTSARDRRLQWPQLWVDQAADLIVQKNQGGATPVSVVFGRESSGLSNSELSLCHYHMQIPANPVYSSLNLAAAVQVFSYELRKHCLALQDAPVAVQHDSPIASVDAVAQMFEHLEKVLHDINFINAEQPEKLRRRIKRMFSRIELEQKEVQIVRGICSAIENVIRQKD